MAGKRSYQAMRVRLLCDSYTRPFDVQDIYQAQLALPDPMTRDELESELAKAPYLRTIAGRGHNARTKYAFKRQWRTFDRVMLATKDCTCGSCGAPIAMGAVVYRAYIKDGNSRKSPWCQRCGLVYVAMQAERLINMPSQDDD